MVDLMLHPIILYLDEKKSCVVFCIMPRDADILLFWACVVADVALVSRPPSCAKTHVLSMVIKSIGSTIPYGAELTSPVTNAIALPSGGNTISSVGAVDVETLVFVDAFWWVGEAWATSIPLYTRLTLERVVDNTL